MTSVRGCDLPEGLYYNIENNVWAQKDGDVVTVGMTSYGCSVSGQIVSFTPRKVGKEVKQNKSCATVESGTWVGPVKAPISGEVVAVNEPLVNSPAMINEDPYGHGWLVKIKVSDWETEVQNLMTGDEAWEAFETKMEAEGFPGC